MGYYKLTETQIKEIYQYIQSGEKQRNIAHQFGISEVLVSNIAHGTRWPYITGIKKSPTLEELSNGKEVRDIPGVDNYYITKDGVVIKKINGQFKIAKPGLKLSSGYKYVNIGGKKKGISVHGRIHYLLCLTFKYDDWFEGAVVRHLDGNPLNNDLDNLRWGTDQENADDRVRHGHTIHGEDCWNSKLTEGKVREIRSLLQNSDLTKTEIAKRFGVKPTAITSIANGHSWAWLE